MFVRDLAQAYSQPDIGLPISPPFNADHDPLRGAEGEHSPAQYWRSQLSGIRPNIHLFGARPYTSPRSFVGETLVENIPTRLLASVSQFCTQHSVGRATVLLSAYAVL